MKLQGQTILAVASDFDGTLIKEGESNPSALFFDTLEKLLARNIPFIAASGRQYGNLRRLLGPFADRVSYIAENGCLVVHRNKVIYKSIFERATAMELIDDMKKQPGTEIMVSGENTSYLVSDNTEFIEMLKNKIRHDTTLLKDYADISEDILKVSIFWKEGIPAEPEQWFHQKYDSRLKVANGGNGWLDFNAFGSGKGEALQVLAEAMNIPLSNVAAFGDNENDLTMLQKAGIGYAVVSASPHIKERAGFICKSVEEVLLEGLQGMDRIQT